MIFLPFPSLHVEQRTATTEEGNIFVVSLTSENGNCPDCSRCSSRVHSHHQGVTVFGDDSAQEDCNRDTERKIGHTLLSSVPKRR